MRYLAALFACCVWANAPAQLTVGIVPVYIDFIPVSQFEYDFIMAAEVTNDGPDAFDVSAVLTGNQSNLMVLDGNVGFGDVPAGAVVAGLDPFVVRIDVRAPYDMELLSWAVSHSESPPETGCIGKDWTSGAQTTTACMHPEDRDFFLEAEFFTYQNVSDRLLVEPSVWCRFDLPNNRLYWPSVESDTCELSQAQLDIAIAVNAGLANWNAQGCLVKPTAIVVTVEFTPLFLSATGGAASPTEGYGHILIDTSIVNASKEARIGAVLHELGHAAVQFEIFPSAIADLWGTQRIWPEAIATAWMIRGMPGSSYFADIHGPWPNRWVGGMMFERARARQAALFINYLEDKADFNSCDFMLNQHAKLLVGDEIGAFEAEVPSLELQFAEFVAAYNMRVLPESPAILLPFNIQPISSSNHPDILYDLSGMQEGNSFSVGLGSGTYYFYFQGATRCQEDSNGVVVLNRTDSGGAIHSSNIGPSHGVFSIQWDNVVAGQHVVTLASPSGNIYMDRLFVSTNPNLSPNDFPPSQESGDPWSGQRQCQ